MAWKFHAGQRVQCIRDDWAFAAARCPRFALPRKGFVYTVRDITPGDGSAADRLFLTMVEIVNPPVVGLGEPAFEDTAFRPLDERRLDQFRVHLAIRPRRRQTA